MPSGPFGAYGDALPGAERLSRSRDRF